MEYIPTTYSFRDTFVRLHIRYTMTLHFQQQHEYITQKYGAGAAASASTPAVATFKSGHTKSLGRTANQMKNPIWEIANPQTSELTAIIMYCEPNEYCELCPTSYQKYWNTKQHTTKAISSRGIKPQTGIYRATTTSSSIK